MQRNEYAIIQKLHFSISRTEDEFVNLETDGGMDEMNL